MKTGLLIASFNRPEYLRQCLASVKAADLSQVQTVLIVDDASTDPDTRRLIDDFDLPGVELVKAFSKENRSIKGSLLFGCDLLFNSCDVVTNLDGDAIVSRNAFNRLIEIHEGFPQHIATGFNCSTLNKDGSVRHKVMSEGEGYNTKLSVGGINMIFDKSVYLQVVRPSLEKCLKTGGNWDQAACLNSFNGYGRSVICIQPSVVQHIGINSAMGHSAGGEPPDVADDFFEERNYGGVYDQLKKSGLHIASNKDIFDAKGWEIEGPHKIILNLPTVTLVAADCVNLERIFKAADKCTEHIQFADVKIFTSLTTDEPRCENIIPIEPITSKEAYSWWIMKQLAQHIKTSHMLVFQYDGYVRNPSAWKGEWLQWDYIGAPWNWYPDNRVGNGGFSLRSKKLMDAVANDPILIPISDGLNTHKEEDHCICRIYRKYLEDKYGIKFAPLEVAKEFSIEGWRSENKTWTNEFGFHGHGLTNVKP